MLTLSTALSTHIAQEVTTLAVCVLLVRTDGTTFGFTSLDVDIVISGVTYKSTDSLNNSLVHSSADLRVDNLEVAGVLTDDRITDDDLLAGKYDNAVVQIFLVNYKALPSAITDTTNLRMVLKGTLGEITTTGSAFRVDVRSLKERLGKDHLEVFGPMCRVKQLGDSRCKVDTDPLTFSYTVSSVIDQRTFIHSSTAQAADYFKYGILKWTGSSSNAPLEATIKEYDATAKKVVLADKMFNTISVGHTFRMTRGCDRRYTTCRDVFANTANFRGEPEHLVKGTDKLVYPL